MSTFGQLFKVTTYGESHCRSVGCIVEGVPPGLHLTNEDVQRQLSRRRPGQSNLTTPRNEADAVEIQSGVEHNITLGSPIGMRVLNKDQRPHDYSETDLYPRPSHADWTYLLKYQLKSSSGGGRSSARETIGRVAAGAIAEKYLKQVFNCEIVAFVSSAGKIKMPFLKELEQQDELSANDKQFPSQDFVHLCNTITQDQVDKDLTRCPDAETAKLITEAITEAKDNHDSIGGTVTCVIRNVPVGLGEPCFDKLEAKLAHAMLSIPATKGFEIGSGFKGAEMNGSTHNDLWVPSGDSTKESKLSTATNRSGGIQGGISNGEHIYFRVAFKPPATIGKPQNTTTYDGVEGNLAARGRHDPCVVPRAVPIVETMAALVIMDALLIQLSRKSAQSLLPNIEIHPSLLGKVPNQI